MGRIQSILDKAERDGAVHRLRNIGMPSTILELPDLAPPLGQPVAPTAPPSATAAARPLPSHQPAERAHGAQLPPPPLGRGRIVDAVRLDRALVASLAPSAAVAEQYRALRTRILNQDTGSAVSVVLVTSPGRSEGKTLTTANLGLTMGQDFQRRVCVIDANLRHPQLHRIFGLPEMPGLSEILTGQLTLSEALVHLEEHQVSLVPAGTSTAHPAELLGTIAMRRTIETLRSSFDRVLIDAPAVMPLADVGILAPLVDTVLLVVRAGVTSRPAISEAIAGITGIDDRKLLGVVLNQTRAA